MDPDIHYNIHITFMYFSSKHFNLVLKILELGNVLAFLVLREEFFLLAKLCVYEILMIKCASYNYNLFFYQQDILKVQQLQYFWFYTLYYINKFNENRNVHKIIRALSFLSYKGLQKKKS